MNTTTMNTTTTPAWTYLVRPSGGDGHRFFRRVSDGRISVADNSGSTPDQTEDGPLFLDRNRKAEVDTMGGRILVVLPVLQLARTDDPFALRMSERPCHVLVTLRDLNWLLDHDLWSASDVTIAASLHPIALLLERIGGLR